MKILLVGANGQLGSDLSLVLPGAGHEVIGVTRAQADIRDADRMHALIKETRPALVINTAAFHNVELCEEQPDEAILVNATAVGRLAVACREQDCVLMHFSTDFVFDGASRVPYTEEDEPHPQSAYARSKLAGERLVRESQARHCIVRTCGLYGATGSKSRNGNFVQKIFQRAATGAEVSVVSDQVVTPTYTLDLAQTLAGLIAKKSYGTFHITNEGECSWHEFAQAALSLSGSAAVAKAISSVDLKTKARRPAYSVLSKEKLYRLGLPRMPHWKAALTRYIANL